MCLRRGFMSRGKSNCGHRGQSRRRCYPPDAPHGRDGCRWSKPGRRGVHGLRSERELGRAARVFTTAALFTASGTNVTSIVPVEVSPTPASVAVTPSDRSMGWPLSNITSTGGATGFQYDDHVTTHEFLQKVPQVQGNQASTVSFRVSALDMTLTDTSAPDRIPRVPGTVLRTRASFRSPKSRLSVMW